MIAALLPQMIRNEYYMTIACQILIYLIAVCGLNFITGLTGQMNLGTAGMFAMGAYVSGLLNVKLGVSPWLGLVAALCVGWLIGKALGYPSLRLRGVYLSLTTIAFTEIIRMLLNNMKGVTNGAQGLRGIERYNFFGYRIEGTIPYYYMVLIVAILVVWFAWRIVNSKWGREFKAVRDNIDAHEIFSAGRIHMETDRLHTVGPLSVDIPRGRLTAVTGVSGSGKTTMVLEMLMPALQSRIDRSPQPTQVRLLEADGVSKAHLIDATPIGANIRSTVATYCGVHDDLRRAFAKTDAARTIGLKAGAFSYNTGKLRCATCDGTGSISLDVQFLPDVDIECPACHGSRYSDAIAELKLPCTDGVAYSMPQLMTMTVDDAMPVLRDVKPIQTKLATLHELGLGYLALGEPTPALSGGEAQRLKLASEMGRKQHDAVFVFDEPTIGLHPLDVRVLLHVFDELVANGATVVVIEHDLDVIANADYVVDMGPGGGEAGGRVVCEGAPSRIAACPESVTGRYLQSSQC